MRDIKTSATGHVIITVVQANGERFKTLAKMSPSPESTGAAEKNARVVQFLGFACPDHHIRGGMAHIVARNAASRMLRIDPAMARANLHTACVCGELDEVRRILTERPAAVAEKFDAPGLDSSVSGNSDDVFGELAPKRWEPLLHLCFVRLPDLAARDNAVAIARLLLEHGADSNAFFMAGGSRYTPLVGVIGEGEEHRLPHPLRDPLARLLLEHGANPFDGQVLYNIHFKGEVLWFLKLIHEVTMRDARAQAWNDPDWSMLGMGGYGNGARFLLTLAIRRNDLELAEWMLQHGANPNAVPPEAKSLPQGSLHAYALQCGNTEMAALLARHGAVVAAGAGEIVGDPFKAACFGLDRPLAEQLVREKPERLLSPAPLMEAARLNRADVVALLLDLGMSPNLPDPAAGNQHALHVAAYSEAVAVIELLLRRGAEAEYREANFGGTALDFAVYGECWRAISVLVNHCTDVWLLTFLGKLDRLREVLDREPALAKTVTVEGLTPLMRLPDDEAAAVEVVRLFLAHGADPSLRNRQGKTAADLARQRYVEQAAELLAKATEV